MTIDTEDWQARAQMAEAEVASYHAYALALADAITRARYGVHFQHAEGKSPLDNCNNALCVAMGVWTRVSTPSAGRQ